MEIPLVNSVSVYRLARDWTASFNFFSSGPIMKIYTLLSIFVRAINIK